MNNQRETSVLAAVALIIAVPAIFGANVVSAEKTTAAGNGRLCLLTRCVFRRTPTAKARRVSGCLCLSPMSIAQTVQS